ncbi:hypothetical protein BX600DRAFT_539665 [Xylariales sp. PMI_506]|nr:hypothetical protein BX600DRAFT_539665 [Xylariales sp. PMI_506]
MRKGHHAAKVGHTKSRRGCVTCKRRHVKCDEVRPLCSNCRRLGLKCTWAELRPPWLTPSALSYPQQTEVAAASNADAARNGARVNATASHDDTTDRIFASLGDSEIDLAESKSRRLLEHRIMCNYYRRTVMPFSGVPPNAEWTNIWSNQIPSLMLEHDCLLHAVLAMSATQIYHDDPEDQEMFKVRQGYLIASLHEQRRGLQALSRDNVTALCLTATTILITSFAMLAERTLDPYLPPVEWLQMGKGTHTVIMAATQLIGTIGAEKGSPLAALTSAYPNFDVDTSYFDASMRDEYQEILDQAIPSSEIWDEETRDVYEKTLSFVGSIQKSIEKGEPVYLVCRRAQAFPFFVPLQFTEYLAERRPRALVVLAHYFGTLAQISRVWWLGGEREGTEPTAKREIRAINSALPTEWREHMAWPLRVAGLA